MDIMRVPHEMLDKVITKFNVRGDSDSAP